MKKLIMLLALLPIITISSAQTMKTIRLNAPDKNGGTTVMKAFDQRKSDRAYAQRELSTQDLSNLLWAANGFNRVDKRTAATAMNRQEIDVYVCMKDGAYLYNAKDHALVQVSAEDIRGDVASGQDFAKTAPVCLVIVADSERFGNNSEQARTMMACDAGIVCQNIYLFCAGHGLATVCRGTMDKVALTEKLGLNDNHILLLNHPVGYPK